MTRFRWVQCCIASFLISLSAHAQSEAPRKSRPTSAVGIHTAATSSLLRELDSSLQNVVAKVSPSVVQIVVNGYGPSEDHGHSDTAKIARQHAIGAGIIVDPDGYIMTNAHVVEGAQRIRVILPPPPADSQLELQPIHAQQILDATLVGTHKQSDLALLKVEATHLPAVSMRRDGPVRQGELVFAIGSPEGLQGTVTMGVVSSVAREPDPDDPMVYIQTDAPINPGNSGGPLVDIDGNVVGINTMMLSKGGGSEGLGFAIPSTIVNFDYENLRKYGHVQRVTIGARTQNITPTMAKALGLSRSWGAIISDINPGEAAEATGLQIDDIVLAVDGRPILGLPDFIAALYLHPPDHVLRIEVLRGASSMSFNVPVVVYHDKEELSDIPVVQKDLVRRLGIFVTDLDEKVRPLVHGDRSDSGVLVVAQAAGFSAVDTGLEAGDIIRAVDRTPVQSMSQFLAMVHAFQSGDPVVLQIERNGKLQYLSFEME
jgi:serine protease Do